MLILHFPCFDEPQIGTTFYFVAQLILSEQEKQNVILQDGLVFLQSAPPIS